MKKIPLVSLCLFFLVLHAMPRDLPGTHSAAASPDVAGYSNNGVTVAGGNGAGPGLNQLNEPNNMYVDPFGNIYIADLNNHRIQKWAIGNLVGITVAGGNGPGAAANQLNHPTDIRFDAAGNMYIADASNHRIQKWAPSASSGTTIAGGNGQGAGAGQLDYPSGVFIDAAGNVYVADYGNNRVQKWAPGSSAGVTVAGGNGVGSAANQLVHPNDVFVDAAGNILVADDANHRIQKWAAGATAGITVAGGNGQGFAANQLSIPTGVFPDALGNLFIADFLNARVQKWAPGASEGITVAGGNGNGPAPNQLSGPVNVFIDIAGNLYISDAYNHRIQRFAVNPPGSTAIGIIVAGGNGFGPAANQLAYPTESFVDAVGNIIIADILNYRIQLWAPGVSAGVTIAGGNGNGPAANQIAPAGIFVDAARNIYVADVYNNRVQKWAPGATAGITVAGGNGAGPAANQLDQPLDVFVDGAGNIYVADNLNRRIQKWTAGAPAGITVAMGSEFSPNSIFVDAAGNIYASSTSLRNSSVLKFAPGDLTGVTVAGGNLRGSGANQLESPQGVFVDPAGNIYIADAGNSRIQKWAPGAQEGITVAGGNGYGTGPGQLLAPFGVFVDASGNIYVTDLGAGIVWKFPPADIASGFCPGNLTIAAASCNEKVTLTWAEPRDTFPASITIPEQLDPGQGSLTFIGTLDGHGYYRSAGLYRWPVARELARRIGGSGVNGHLVTLNSAGENDFLYGNVKGSGYSPWIGLFNTGRPGRFRWVTDEPLTYTNWAPGEPNNAGGNSRNVLEPYVRFSDAYNSWNDQRDIDLPFIAEFEKPLIRYKQISGPRIGSERKAGEYMICYERTDQITDRKDTCCFSVTVTCTPALAATDIHSPAVSESVTNIGKGLQVFTMPNPSSDMFRLQIAGTNRTEKISLTVSDLAGRILETRNGLVAGQTLQLGRNLKPGMYFIRVTQGTSKTVVKIIKQ